MAKNSYILVILVSVLASAGAADLTSKLELSQHSGTYFEGKICFTVPVATSGWEIKLAFAAPGVKNIKAEADVIHPPADCGTTFVMVNKNYMGSHTAGDKLCLSIQGTPCGTGEPSATGTYVDLSNDGMKIPPIPSIAGAQKSKYNYVEVLLKSLLFFEAQRSGKLPANNRIPWRGDSALQDKGDKGEDLTGGLYDAGDNVKFNFPMAYSATVLCWGYLEFPDAYKKSQQDGHLLDSVRWILDYLLKCHTGPEELYIQVGEGNADHAAWTRPESMDPKRPAYKIDAAHPGSEAAGETAAAMACGSIAFKATDPAYSAKLLQHAKQIYDFAQKHRGFYSTSVNQAAAFYRSGNYTDELTWGGAWLHKATGDASYLDKAKATYESGAAWGFSWDEKLFGNMVLMYDATKDAKYKADIAATMTYWSKAGGFTYTPKCLAFRLQWGALRYASNTAFVALVAAKYLDQPTAAKYRQWALCQIHYALGDAGRSYVVGFGVNPPTQPHHRASSCPSLPVPCSWDSQRSPGPNPHTLYGALVGGPGAADDYKDARDDYIHNEVACDYNAGFQGAIAALIQLSIGNALPDSSQCGHC